MPTAGRDPCGFYDGMRQRGPVAHRDLLDWSLSRHEDVLRVLQDAPTLATCPARGFASLFLRFT